MAFSIIFDTCDLTTIGLISSRITEIFVDFFCRGTSHPNLRYSGIIIVLTASVTSAMIFSFRWALDFSM
jgi:hypothetical protein